MMASTRFKFIKAFDMPILRYKRTGSIRAFKAYPAGYEDRILEEQAKLAEAAGVGHRIKKKIDNAD